MPDSILKTLQANEALSHVLKCTVRIQREYVDHGIRLWEEPECVQMKNHYSNRMRTMEQLVVELGAPQEEAKKLVMKLVMDLNTSTNSIQQRAWMSIDEAMEA
jgi:hypothetical protein